MGAIRGILLVFVCVFLFLSLLIGNIFLTLNLSLEYENVKVELGSVLNNIIEDQNLEVEIKNNFGIMTSYCQTNSEYLFRENNSGYTFILPCEVVSQGFDATIDHFKTSLIEQIYYKDYNCGFWDCLNPIGSDEEITPFFLVSEKAKNYWNSKFYFNLLISLGLIALVFLLTDKKINTFIITGSLLIVASLPFIKLDWALSLISGESFLGLLNVFFSESYTIFVISLVLGIIILGIGILLKLFKIGFKISNICSKIFKNDKKVSKEEKVKPEKELSVKKEKKSKESK